MERIFEYAIIRLTPYAHRGESLNIGVVVFLSDELDIELQARAALVKAFGVEPSSVSWIERFLREHDEPTLPVRERWRILSSCAGFSLSELGWFQSNEEAQYEVRISGILNDYVDRPRFPSLHKKRSNLVRELRKEFSSRQIMGKKKEDLDRHKIVANTPVGPSGKLHVDFLLRNGTYHATETVDFRSAEDSGVPEMKEAALAAFTLRYARDQLGSNSTQCYFVFAAPVIIEKAIGPAIELVENDADDVFNIESLDDKVRYLDKILAAAGAKALFAQ